MIRLKELRAEFGLTRADLSRAVGINQGTLANYENGIREADYKTLITLAGFFDVSVDYLIAYDLAGEEAILGRAKTGSFRPLSSSEKRFISRYRMLSKKSRELVDDTLSHLYDMEN